jgi:hypothetical protein
MQRRIQFVVLTCLATWLVAAAAFADTTVGDFEAMNRDQQAQTLADVTNKVVDKIAVKNPVIALKIQEYFIVPQKGEKHARGAVALYQQISEYDQIDPQGYTVENAFAKVLSDWLAQNAATTQPATQPASS